MKLKERKEEVVAYCVNRHWAKLVMDALESVFGSSHFRLDPDIAVKAASPAGCRVVLRCRGESERLISDMQVYASGFYACLRAHCVGE
jgi:hypothetical protein